MTRSYGQFCPAAKALDVVGGRWTLLIIRELLMGPRRYNELIAGLPGIGPNVLASRLRETTSAGLVRRATTATHGVAVYQLTPEGQALRPVVDELSKWGMRSIGAPDPGDLVKVDWLMGCLQASFRPELATGLHETYEFRVDGHTFCIQISDGRVAARHGAAVAPVCRIESDLATFMALGAKLLDAAVARGAGLANFTGDLTAVERAITIVGPHFEAMAGHHGMFGAIRASFDAVAAKDICDSYQFDVDDHVFHVNVDHGEIEAAEGPADDPSFHLTASLSTLLALVSGNLTLLAAASRGQLQATGDGDAGLRLASVFGIQP